MLMRMEKMASGFEQIDGIWYYFRSWGGMARNTFLTHKNIFIMLIRMER